jgi:hypothetical protein
VEADFAPVEEQGLPQPEMVEAAEVRLGGRPVQILALREVGCSLILVRPAREPAVAVAVRLRR